MNRPLTPAQLARHLGIHSNSVHRFIDEGQLCAVVHPEALRVFMDSKRVGKTDPGSSATEMIAELDACDVVLLADFMEHLAGSFFKALAGALRQADPINRSSLYAAFPRTLHGYLQMQRATAAESGVERA